MSVSSGSSGSSSSLTRGAAAALLPHRAPASPIEPAAVRPPVEIPVGHVGMVVVPGTGRQFWWTGRVAIGLRHQARAFQEPATQSANWIQGLLLGRRAARTA